MQNCLEIFYFGSERGSKRLPEKGWLIFGLCKPSAPNCPNLQCTVKELAGGGSMVVAIGVSDMWQVTRDVRHMTPYTWHLTSYTWNKTINFHLSIFSCSLYSFPPLFYWCYYPHMPNYSVSPLFRNKKNLYMIQGTRYMINMFYIIITEKYVPYIVYWDWR